MEEKQELKLVKVGRKTRNAKEGHMPWASLGCHLVLAIRLVLSKWEEGGGKTEGEKEGTEEDEWCSKLEDTEEQCLKQICFWL